MTRERDRNLELAGRNLPHVRVLPVIGVNVRDVLLAQEPGAGRRRRPGADGATAMKDLRQVIRRPVITEKSTIERETRNIVTFAVHLDANKHEIKRAVEELFDVKVEDVRTAARARQDAPRRQDPGSAPVVEEGARAAARGRLDRVLRGSVSCRPETSNPPLPAGAACRCRTSSRSRRPRPRSASPRASRARVAATTAARSPATTAAAATRSATARSTSARQARHPREGRRDRVRPEPLGADRAAPLRRRREALHPGADRPQRRRRDPDRRARRDQARQRAAAAAASRPARSCTTSSSSPARGGQLVRSAGMGAQLMALRGEVRAAQAARRARRARCSRPASPRSARSATSSTRTSRSARPAARAGSASGRTCAASR